MRSMGRSFNRSAPSHGLDGADISKGDQLADSIGNEQWSETIEKHLPLILRHRSPMVCQMIPLIFTFCILLFRCKSLLCKLQILTMCCGWDVKMIIFSCL